MGAALGDYDGDGRLDIVKTNFADDYPNLYRNLGKGAYTDRALHAGLGVNPQYVLWSAAFADFDNDTRPDLFLSAGHVFPSGPRAPRLLYWNLGDGKFADVSAKLGRGIYSSRGGAVCDFDNDGHLDIVVMNMNEAPSLLRNQGAPSTNWLKVALRGTRSNRMAIGARVRVSAGGRWQTQAMLSQSGYYSSNDPRIHFGLGPATVAEAVEIVWPDGKVQRWRDVKANQVFQAVEK
jgi:hypothetical protein